MNRYSAKYFGKTKRIIKNHKGDSIVTLQFFQRKDNSLLGGIDEALEFLKKNTDTSKYEILYLPEGSKISNYDIVLQLKGKYEYFGEFEGVIDGILSRSTSLATNAMHIVEVANGKKVIFMGDRADHYKNQEIDGKAVALGGISTQVTDAHVALHDGTAIGTIPHVLIQMFEGDLVAAIKAYKKEFPDEPTPALVDFNNDIIGDSLKVIKAFPDLYAVRVDTSSGVSDAYFKNDEEYGVTPNLIKALRKALDENGGSNVKIIVSSGFDVEKIKLFEKEKTPVDVYGVGASLLKINNTFSADAVEVNGKKIAKVGRKKQPIDRLIKL